MARESSSPNQDTQEQQDGKPTINLGVSKNSTSLGYQEYLFENQDVSPNTPLFPTTRLIGLRGE